MWELDCEESWASKNCCFWTVVLEKTLESPLDCKEIQPVHSEGDQPWDFFGRTDAKAETPILWPPYTKSWLIGKDSDAGRDWGQEEKGSTEDEMAAWHHWLDGRESEWTPGVGDGQGGLAFCNSWGRKELDTTERLNWTELHKDFAITCKICQWILDLCICFLYSLLHLTLACLHGGPSPVPGALIFGEEDGVCMTGRASSSIHILNYWKQIELHKHTNQCNTASSLSTPVPFNLSSSIEIILHLEF